MEKFTVSLDDFIKYSIKKWMIVVLCVVVGVTIFVVSAMLLGKEFMIPPSEKYAELKAEEASYVQYIDNAPLMKIDSTNVHERIIYLSNVVEREQLKNFVESGKVWNAWGDELFKHYFVDHITWYDSTAQTAEIKIQYYEEEECRKLAEYLIEQIVKYDDSIEILLGDAYVSNDEIIADVQVWYRNRLDDVQGQLEHTAAGYVIETNMPMMVIVGAIAGLFVAIISLFVAFLYTLKKNDMCE